MNTVVVPNNNDCNTDVGDGSSGIKGGKGDDNSAVPPPPPPPHVVLVIVVVFDATSLLPAVAPVDRGICYTE